MKRQRGRGRKPGGGHHHGGGGGGGNFHPNRSMESNGPEGGKVRGNASLILERYLQLARDAASSGDRVLSENYMQHADHYFRLVRQMQPAVPVQQVNNDRFENDYESDEDGGEAGGEGEAHAAEGGGEQPDADFPQGERQQHFDRGDRSGERGGDGDFRRGRNNRNRRNRFRSEGGEGGGEHHEGREPREAREPREPREPREDGGEMRSERSEGGERPERAERQERSERPPRRERQPREPRADNGGEQAGPEGFSNGPRPAFLRSE
ncbi:DUF4167 domain-containing protein [Vitreimonas flagellata]|uniref:DUF4167 domain-containing protein n=1 Tax=Vitreimonas flagellata TaxID=2560861 RepID=UPI0010752667|nr:DUF4167 domain-containing protein [Vitreimonas flagellata]